VNEVAAAKDRDMIDCVVIVPVLARPHRVEPFLTSLVDATADPVRVVFVATAGDTAMIDAVIHAADGAADIVLEVLPPNRVGDYAKKVNFVYGRTTEPFMFLAADDLHFHDGWLEAAMAEMANPAIGVVGTQDLAPTDRARTGDHATHCLIRRSYIDERGTIDERGKVLHEGYPHEYVDDELVGTAKARHAWAFAHGSVVEHLHPSWGKAPPDRLYRDQRRRMSQGRVIYRRRSGLWAPALSR
jgi:hypothetical protein